MAKTHLHPLETFVVDNETSLPAFAAKHKISLRKLYNHLDPGWRGKPTLETMEQIERATRRKVTVQMQANWFKRRPRHVPQA